MKRKSCLFEFLGDTESLHRAGRNGLSVVSEPQGQGLF